MELITQNDHIEFILDHYGSDLGEHMPAYHNHVYRLYNIVIKLSKRNLNPDELEKFSIAAAFHDLGIWTDSTFDYLDPSIKLAHNYLDDFHKPEWKEEISATIYWHHKITAYNGPYAEAVNLFRKADWIDVTNGFRSFGLPRMKVVHLYAEFPDEGFHKFLLQRAFKWGIKNPLRPLPMFKR